VKSADLKKYLHRAEGRSSSAAMALGRRALFLTAAVLAAGSLAGFGVVRGQEASASSGAAKSAHPSGLTFDVVSIKPTPTSDDKTLIEQFPDGTAFHGAPVRMVLRTAFGVEDDRILGAPWWVDIKRYDIEAKVAPEEAPKLEKLKAEDRNAMLIPLLTERFNMKYHHETRERSTYALVVAKGGPKLTPGEPDPPRGGASVAAGQSPPADPAHEHYKIMAVPGDFEADSVPMWVLADMLTRILGRTVADKTGLSGNYNFSLRWTPENVPPVVGGTAANATGAENGNGAALPSLFTAIQEQLGLRLESEKNSVDVIVIDQIEPPSAN
jgi:uncharacterized protein (TIGR03435 family)